MLQEHWVPILHEGTFDLETIMRLVDGKSTVVGAKNIREGVVITSVNQRQVRGLGRVQLKLISNAFLEAA